MRASRNVRLIITAFYFTGCNILFFLPGSAFPKEDWLSRIYFDKWVHIGLFALLALLVCWSFPRHAPKTIILLMLLVGYGLAVELIQGAFIANRSCDLYDLLADGTGALAGLLLRKSFSRRAN
jgi:VanZ family protein